MSYVKEPFEELDVMNYYMFNKLTTVPGIAEEFCKCMIRNLLGREVTKIKVNAESIKVPDSPDKRGVRLDVEVTEVSEDEVVANIYDIEPHKSVEPNYPKKNRFTLAHIDKNNLKSGDNDFSHLPDVYIICITNYDPFGYGRMIYTIKNACIEEPELVYNDGVRIMYFNTKGTVGGSKSLQDFLHYLEESRNENVKDEAIKEIDGLVQEIRCNNRIGGEYMTLGELMDRMVDERVEEVVEEILAGKDKELEKKSEELAGKDKELEKKSEELAGKDKELEKKSEELAGKDKELEKKSEELVGKDKELEKKSEELAGKDKELEKKSEELAGKDKELEKKSEELAGKDKELEKKSEELAGKDKELEKKSEELAGKDKELEKKSEELAGKDKELEKKDKRIAELEAQIALLKKK